MWVSVQKHLRMCYFSDNLFIIKTLFIYKSFYVNYLQIYVISYRSYRPNRKKLTIRFYWKSIASFNIQVFLIRTTSSYIGLVEKICLSTIIVSSQANLEYQASITAQELSSSRRVVKCRWKNAVVSTNCTILMRVDKLDNRVPCGWNNVDMTVFFIYLKTYSLNFILKNDRYVLKKF